MSTNKPFISVYMPIAGWKAIKYWYNEEDIPGQGFWEPWETGMFAYNTKAEAIQDAKTWAEAEGLEFKDTDPDTTEDAPDKSVTEQLTEIFGDSLTTVELK